METFQWIFLGYLAGINILAFCLYGIDKKKARKGKWRIPEKVLLATGFVGGAYGACLGMNLWHHKTKKIVFRALVPAAFVLETVIVLVVLALMT